VTQEYRNKFLLIDDACLLQAHGLRRRVNPAVKHPGPVLTLNARWNQPDERFSYANLLYDPDAKLFRMWYFVWRGAASEGGVVVEGGNKLAYATSPDGVHWERPELGLVQVNGSSRNNYVIPEMGLYGGTLIHDPSDPPPRRYKMIFGVLGREANWAGFHVPLGLAFSADGLRWERPQHVNPVLRGISDGELSLLYDADRRTYQLYTRRVPNLPRDISLYESHDLVNWEDRGRILVPDEGDPPEMYNFYNLAPFRYEGLFLGLLNTQHTDPVSETYESYHQAPGFPKDIRGHVDIQLAYSRDGRDWTRPLDRSPVVPCGGPGAPDFGGVYPSKYPLVVDGETFIYYTASRLLHCWWHERQKPFPENDICCLMLARMPEDHWVSLDAGSEEGWLLAKPFASPSRLLVNADAGNGRIEAELLTPYGEPVTGFARADCLGVSGNGKDQEIRWRTGTDPRSLNAQHLGGLCLKIHVRNAKLYSYSLMEPDPDGAIRRYWDSARWNETIKHRSGNWGGRSNDPAGGLPPTTAGEPGPATLFGPGPGARARWS
jgi:hypothetical protein